MLHRYISMNEKGLKYYRGGLTLTLEYLYKDYIIEYKSNDKYHHTLSDTLWN